MCWRAWVLTLDLLLCDMSCPRITTTQNSGRQSLGPLRIKFHKVNRQRQPHFNKKPPEKQIISVCDHFPVTSQSSKDWAQLFLCLLNFVIPGDFIWLFFTVNDQSICKAGMTVTFLISLTPLAIKLTTCWLKMDVMFWCLIFLSWVTRWKCGSLGTWCPECLYFKTKHINVIIKLMMGRLLNNYLFGQSIRETPSFG